MSLTLAHLIVFRLYVLFLIFTPLAGVCIREKPKAKKKTAKARPTVRKYKKSRKREKREKPYKPPKLTLAQQRHVEKYGLGGNRYGVIVGGAIPD